MGKFYYKKAFYFTDLYCNRPSVIEKIKEAKEIMLKSIDSLPISLEEINNNFEIALNLYKKSVHLNTYLSLNTDITENWLKWLYKNLNKELAPVYWQLYEKMVKIPDWEFCDQFTIFEELRNKMGSSEIFVLSLEELEFLKESAIRVLKEFKKELQKETEKSNVEEEEKAGRGNSEGLKGLNTLGQKISTACRIKELFYSNLNLSNPQIAERLGTTENYVKTALYRERNRKK